MKRLFKHSVFEGVTKTLIKASPVWDVIYGTRFPGYSKNIAIIIFLNHNRSVGGALQLPGGHGRPSVAGLVQNCGQPSEI